MVAERTITINSNTRIKVLLDADQQRVMSRLIQLNANFSRLRNPLFRNLLAPRVTIADACRIAGCELRDFLTSMALIGFRVEDEMKDHKDSLDQKIDFNRAAKVTVLDVRPYLEKEQDPLKLILTHVNKLQQGERIKIFNTFEPVPLIDLLVDQGFLYHTDHIDGNLVVTWFEKHEAVRSRVEVPALHESSAEESLFNQILHSFAPEMIRYIDVRQLEMPQPMLLIMDNIKDFSGAELLFVYHKKVPVLLLPELERRGLSSLFNHQENGTVEMLIYRS